MKISDWFQTKKFKIILAGLGVFIGLLLVFQLGVFVGFSKARWSFQWGDNYHKNFGGPRGGFLRDFEGQDFIGGHGTPGAVVQVDGDSIIIKDPRGMERIVTVSAKTTLKKGTADFKLSDLRLDDRLVIIGSPRDDGSIEAQLIRVFDPNDLPPPPAGRLQFR
jgi:hypothetical protein